MEIRTAFHKRLREIQSDVLTMGSMVEKAISRSIEALKERDLDKARRIITDDQKINKNRFDIEEKCVEIIATQQPMAKDLRSLAAVLDITGELERMGDYAKGIARINLLIGEGPLLKPLVDIPLMAEKARDMLHDSLEAFVRRDVEQARAIPPRDGEVDDLYNQVYRELLVYVIADQSAIEQSNFLLWVAHNLERTADRVTNICERVVYSVTGEFVEMDSEAGLEGIT